MAMDDKGGMSGYSKPKNNPNSKKKIKARQDARKAFVESKPGMDKKEARKRFFVQTRMAEAAKSGKKLDKKALRQKFESGDVRKGFGAPKKKTGTNGAVKAPQYTPPRTLKPGDRGRGSRGSGGK